jgi:hypothetical protein
MLASVRGLKISGKFTVPEGGKSASPFAPLFKFFGVKLPLESAELRSQYGS